MEAAGVRAAWSSVCRELVSGLQTEFCEDHMCGHQKMPGLATLGSRMPCLLGFQRDFAVVGNGPRCFNIDQWLIFLQYWQSKLNIPPGWIEWIVTHSHTNTHPFTICSHTHSHTHSPTHAPVTPHTHNPPTHPSHTYPHTHAHIHTRRLSVPSTWPSLPERPVSMKRLVSYSR